MGFAKMAVSCSLMVMLVVLNLSPLTGETIPSGSKAETNLVETDNASQPIRQKDDTVRVDPLDHLRKYRGGYDIRNLHYWSSTAYTGIPGYVLGVLWLLCGLLYGISLLVTKFCFKRKDHRKLKKRSSFSRQFYLWPILLAIFFTILAVTASGLVLGGDSKFHSRAKTVVDILIDTADNASGTIYNTTGAMKVMSVNLDSSYGGTDEAASFLDSTSQTLDSRAADIERQARKNRHKIELGLRIVYIVTTCIIALNLVAAIALSVFGILKLRQALHLFIILCWLLVVFCWVFFGLYFFIEKFAGDTCTAFESFQQDPYNNTLSSILPCDELVSTQSVLKEVSAGVYNLVNQVNKNISGSQADSFVQICNPFSAPPQYNYQPENCPSTAIRIGDIPKALKLISCSDDSTRTCNGGIYISSSDFKRLEAYTTSIQNLLNAYPGLDSLVECQTVKDAFSLILRKHCKPLKRETHMVWASMVFLSVVMVILVLLWTIQARQERRDHLSDSSVRPHFGTTDNMMESETVEAVKNDSVPSSVNSVV